jgi:N-acetyl-1-D-myo-inositol-2-amino-2-deoxy-alpha-D-glucopyranoside deacetylase
MTAPALADRRLLLVHAHPDDETITTGVTMARYAAEGAQVTLVTCTLGEEGEVLVPELEHLAAGRDDRLGEHRITERDGAMAALGVTDARWLGGPGRYRDTGMAYAEDGQAAMVPPQVRDDSFWRADLREAATDLVPVIREVRPQVLVTYDDFGNYGHPDHVQAHRVATYATALAAAPLFRPDLGEAWEVAKVYWTTTPRSVMRESARRMAEAGVDFFDGADPESFPGLADDELVTTRIDGTAYHEQKMDAMRAYPTQIAVDGPFFALSNNIGREAWGHEYFTVVKGQAGPQDAEGYEDDLFAGLDLDE